MASCLENKQQATEHLITAWDTEHADIVLSWNAQKEADDIKATYLVQEHRE